MSSPNYLTHWEVNGYSPAGKLFIDHFPTEAQALACKARLEAEGYRHINIVPPRNPTR